MIYFVRHGQTDYNVKKFRTGQTDIPINETGLLQAKETAKSMKKIHFDKCYCSPLLRTRQTCSEILKYHKGLEVVFDDRLKECSFGKLEGTPFNEDELKDRRFGKDGELAKKYDMETIEDVYKRVSSFYDDLKRNEKDKNILIVSHGGIALISNAYFNGVPKDGNLQSLIVKNADYVCFDNVEKSFE